MYWYLIKMPALLLQSQHSQFRLIVLVGSLFQQSGGILTSGTETGAELTAGTDLSG